MSENTITMPAPTDADALRTLLDADETVLVYFDGCPIPGTLGMVHADGVLDVDVHDEDGRYEGVYYVAPGIVLALELG